MTGGDGVTHAVLPSTAGKLHVECSPTLKLGEPGLSGGHGPRLAVVVRAFWAIVGGQEGTKEESQPPVRAKAGATLVPGRKSESIMKADLIQAASEVITNQQILVNMVSRRVRQLSLGHRPLVEYAPGLREADIALTEIANGKLTFESTFGQNGNAEPVPHVVQFPESSSPRKRWRRKKRRDQGI